MTCGEVEKVLEAFVDGELPGGAMRETARHLARCASCEAMAVQLEVLQESVRRAVLDEVAEAVKMSNLDVGAGNIEVNSVEYLIRGLGFIENLQDIENSVIKANDNVPVYVKDVAVVTQGPALRRGALNKGGAEAVGGVVVARYG